MKQTLSTAVIGAVADAEDVDPTDLTEPLYNVVNTDALDALFQAETGTLTFEYHGYRVSVHATGEVELDPLDSE